MMTRRTSGNRRKGGIASSRHHLLELNVRTASLKRQQRQKVSGLFWKAASLTVILVFLAVGGHLVAEKFFFRNAEYALHHLDAQLDGIMTQQELVDLTGFEEGRNLFLLDLDLAKKKLDGLPEVRSSTLERVQPDTVKVKIERRIPVLLFAGSGDSEEAFIPGKSFLCDRDGVLMQPTRLDPEFLNLPVLKGVDPGAARLGTRLENDRLAYALGLQAALSEIPEETFKIRSLDVTKEYDAVVTDASNARYTFGNDDLPGQLDRLRKLLSHCQETGRRIETADLILTRNTPVTFFETPETAAPKITPVPTGKNSSNKRNAKR
jgi:cell division septal protein FtsQ